VAVGVPERHRLAPHERDRPHGAAVVVRSGERDHTHLRPHGTPSSASGRTVNLSITGLDRKRSAMAAACSSAAPSPSASTVSVLLLPTRTSETLLHPSAGSAS